MFLVQGAASVEALSEEETWLPPGTEGRPVRPEHRDGGRRGQGQVTQCLLGHDEEHGSILKDTTEIYSLRFLWLLDRSGF